MAIQLYLNYIFKSNLLKISFITYILFLYKKKRKKKQQRSAKNI